MTSTPRILVRYNNWYCTPVLYYCTPVLYTAYPCQNLPCSQYGAGAICVSVPRDEHNISARCLCAEEYSLNQEKKKCMKPQMEDSTVIHNQTRIHFNPSNTCEGFRWHN